MGESKILNIEIFQIVVYCKAVERLPLRLNGSEDSYSGELQVYVNDSWGSFCYGRSFYFTTAKVLCKTLGFKTAESLYRINITNAPLAVDRVSSCYSNLDSFFNCSWTFHREDEDYHYCYDNTTVGVVCSDGERLIHKNCSSMCMHSQTHLFVLSVPRATL